MYHILKDRKDLENIVNKIVLQQEQDTKILNIRKRLMESEAIINKFYCIYKDILFIKTKKNKDTWKLVIPHSLENQIIKDYHVRYGHMGTLKIVKALEEDLFIKNITRKVNKNIKTCTICQMVKTNNERNCLLYTS